MVSPATATKLAAKHGVAEQDVRDAIVGVRGLCYGWDDHPERGRRALVEVEIRGRSCICVLYPVDDPLGDRYALASAYPR